MRVGFIGLGTMGSSMALNARKGGHDLVVHDLKREATAPHLAAGATWADSPEAAAREADVVLTSLPGPREVEAVGEKLFQDMRRGAAWFDLSTTFARRSSATAEELRRAKINQGIRHIRASGCAAVETY